MVITIRMILMAKKMRLHTLEAHHLDICLC